jgi:putative flippase GtrA
VAWFAGAIVNYFLNRWAWGRRGRASRFREVLPYWGTAVASLVISTATAKAASMLSHHVPHTEATLIVGATYLITNGVLFVGKFVLFHFVIFTDGRPAHDPTV